MIFTLLGPPAAGKGTVGAIISEKYEIPTISTGQLLRELSCRNKEISERLKNGNFVDDNLINYILLDRIHENDCKNGFILDGYPRNIEQAKFLDEFLNNKGMQIDKIILLEASEETIKNRILFRTTCENCGKIHNKNDSLCGKCKVCGGKLCKRDDDDLEVLKNRLSAYNNLTTQLLKYYDKNKVEKFNANEDLENFIRDIV